MSRLAIALAALILPILATGPAFACRVAPPAYNAGEVYPVVLAVEALQTAASDGDAWSVALKVDRVLVGSYAPTRLQLDWRTWPGKCEYFAARPERGRRYVVMLESAPNGDLFPRRFLSLEDAVRLNPNLVRP